MELGTPADPRSRASGCIHQRASATVRLAAMAACISVIVAVGFAERVPAQWAGVCIMSAFVMTTVSYILSVDIVFGMYYLVSYIYTIFTQIAYVAFPSKLSVVSGGQYYGAEWFWPFYAFTFASFFGAFLLFVVFRSWHQHLRCFRLTDSRPTARLGKVAFVALILIHNLVMVYYTATRYESLGYYTQGVLKSDKLFFFGFAFYQYTIYASYVNWREYSTAGWGRSVAVVILMISILIFLTICVRAGQRIEIVALCVGLFVYLLAERKPRSALGMYLGAFCVGIGIFGFVNAIRMLRGSQIHLAHVANLLLTQPGKFVTLTLEDAVFQDYCGPSLTLVTSMYYGRVDPIEAVKSLVANSLVFLDVPSLGERVSRFIEPYGTRGYGYYVFTEGFEVMGWAGFIYNAVIMNLGISLWRPLLRTGNGSFTRYMTGIMAMGVFSVARGTSSSYLKSIYMYFVPCIVLFCLMSGARPCLPVSRWTYGWRTSRASMRRGERNLRH